MRQTVSIGRGRTRALNGRRRARSHTGVRGRDPRRSPSGAVAGGAERFLTPHPHRRRARSHTGVRGRDPKLSPSGAVAHGRRRSRARILIPGRARLHSGGGRLRAAVAVGRRRAPVTPGSVLFEAFPSLF